MSGEISTKCLYQEVTIAECGEWVSPSIFVSPVFPFPYQSTTRSGSSQESCKTSAHHASLGRIVKFPDCERQGRYTLPHLEKYTRHGSHRMQVYEIQLDHTQDSCHCCRLALLGTELITAQNPHGTGISTQRSFSPFCHLGPRDHSYLASIELGTTYYANAVHYRPYTKDSGLLWSQICDLSPSISSTSKFSQTKVDSNRRIVGTLYRCSTGRRWSVYVRS